MTVSGIAFRSHHSQARAIVTHIPREITLLFLQLVAGNQVASMRRVCRHFSHEIGNQDLWKLLFQRDFPREEIPKEVLPSLQYERCFRTETNWKKGQYVYQRLNCGEVLSWTSQQLFCNVNEPPLWALTVQIWDLRGATLTHSLVGFPGLDTIDYCTPHGDYLIAGANGGPTGGFATKVWNRITGALLLDVGCWGEAIFDGTKLFIPSQQWRESHYLGGIRVWDRNTGHVTELISDPDFNDLRGFLGFRLVGDYVFATSKGFVKIWNKNTGTLVRQIGSSADSKTGHPSFEVDGGNLICGYEGRGKIKIWKIEDGSLINVLTDPQDEISSIDTLKVDEDVIMVKCEDSIDENRPQHIVCWNKKDGMFRFKIATKGRLQCLDGDRFIVLFRGTFEIRNKYTGDLLKTCQAGPENAFVKFVKVDEHRIFSLLNHVLEIWDKHTGDVLFLLKDVIDCKVIGNRMVIRSEQGRDICDFSFIPEIPFPMKGQLPRVN